MRLSTNLARVVLRSEVACTLEEDAKVCVRHPRSCVHAVNYRRVAISPFVCLLQSRKKFVKQLIRTLKDFGYDATEADGVGATDLPTSDDERGPIGPTLGEHA